MPRPLVIGALVLVLAGCTPAAPPTPPPAPVPTFMCTPEAGGAEFRCDQKAHDEMVAKDALYQEATVTARRIADERIRSYRAGAPADEVVLAFTTGSGTEQLRAGHSSAPRLSGGEVLFSEPTRLVGLSREGSTVALQSCWDAHTTTNAQGGPGGIWLERVYFAGPPGQLKATFFERKEVSSCTP